MINAEPGAGKSLGLPVALLDLLMETNPNARIIVSESRKNLVKQLGSNGPREAGKPQNPKEMTLKDRLGDDVVGYSNVDNKAPATARIDFAVEQTLINRLIANPSLEGWSGVIVDEAHRYMGILKPLLKRAQELNPDLVIIFATGTADVARERLHSMFPGMGELKIEGRKYDLTPEWHTSSSAKNAPEDAAKLVEELITEGKKGNMLTFLPGGSELDKFIERLKASTVINADDLEIIRVMGKDTDTLERINKTTDKTKIIAATNALEEGIDPKCDTVIVSGWRKIRTIDPLTGIEHWKTVRISKDSAEQQSKRTGRTGKGTAHFLFTEADLNNKAEFPPEDREDSDLTNDVLALIAAGYSDIRNFEFEGDKIPSHIDAAFQRLQKLGALDKNEKLTDIGRYMADRETAPHFARMLYEAEKRGCDDAVAILIGIMNSDRSLFKRDAAKDKFTHPESDFLAILEIWNQFVKVHYDNNLSGTQKNEKFTEMENSGINVSVLMGAAAMRRDLVKIRGNLYPEVKLSGEGNQSADIQNSMLAGLIDKLLIRDTNGTYHLENGRKSGIRISLDSGLAEKRPKSIVSGKIVHSDWDKNNVAELNQMVDQETIYELFPYLKELQAEKPIVKEVEKKPEIATQPTSAETARDTEEVKHVTDQTESIESEVAKDNSSAAIEDAKTFIQKMKDNWHNLTERVRDLVRAFKERVKRFIGLS